MERLSRFLPDSGCEPTSAGFGLLVEVDDERCGRRGFDVLDPGFAEQLGQDERTVPCPEDRLLGDHRVGDPRAVRGYVHVSTIFGSPLELRAVMVTTTRPAPTTRSIAPPTPSTPRPGTAQFAMSPAALT